jgi:hypothetical protein
VPEAFISEPGEMAFAIISTVSVNSTVMMLTLGILPNCGDVEDDGVRTVKPAGSLPVTSERPER